MCEGHRDKHWLESDDKSRYIKVPSFCWNRLLCDCKSNSSHASQPKKFNHLFFPRLVLWDSFYSYSLKSRRPLMCPDHFAALKPTGQWMNGTSNSHNPRVAWDTNGFLLLVQREYSCPGIVGSEGHRIRTTDSQLTNVIGQNVCDVIFSRKCTFFKIFMANMADELTRGISFFFISQKLMQRVHDFISLCK